jgi:hypothetical protein
MFIKKTTSQEADLTINHDELLILNNSINEALEALDDSELSTRMGCERSEAHALMKQIQALLTKMGE